MRTLVQCFTILAALACAAPAAAQHRGTAAAAASAPAPEARQFDFLIGEWTITASPKVGSLAALLHGAPELAGTWTAERAFDGRGIEDELRIVDASGNPMSLTRALRIWSPGERRWLVTSVDAYRARIGVAHAVVLDGAMRVEASGSDAEGKAYLARSRFEPQGPDRFRLVQDRSHDGGRTWDEAVLVIDATRAGAAP